MQDINTRLQGIFTNVFDDESIKIHREMTAEEVEMWDSLTHMTLIAEIEEGFGFNFTFDEIEGFKNVGSMIDCIASKAK